MTLQADEYGRGKPGASHAELFAETMSALDLDPTPGAYIDRIPGTTLAHARLAVDDLIGGLGATDHRAPQDVPFGIAALMLAEGPARDRRMTRTGTAPPYGLAEWRQSLAQG